MAEFDIEFIDEAGVRRRIELKTRDAGGWQLSQFREQHKSSGEGEGERDGNWHAEGSEIVADVDVATDPEGAKALTIEATDIEQAPVGMRVRLRAIEGSAIHRLEVVEPGPADAHVGESVGYLCGHCKQADETRHQIWHEEGCPLAGRHGRDHYDDLEPDVDGLEDDDPELEEHTEITMVVAAGTYRDLEIYHGDCLGFRCRCGNLDEDLFEVVHDSRCELADDGHGLIDEATVPVSRRQTDDSRP